MKRIRRNPLLLSARRFAHDPRSLGRGWLWCYLLLLLLSSRRCSSYCCSRPLRSRARKSSRRYRGTEDRPRPRPRPRSC